MTSAADVTWVVAILAPWAISPHPNFSTGDVSPSGRLALVSEMRAYELEQYGDDPDAWVNGLVDAATRSLALETQHDASVELWNIVDDHDVPLAARVAAGAYALLGWSELDRAEDGLARYVKAFDLWALDNPADSSSSARLIRAAALAQAAFRAEEAGHAQDSAELLRRTLRWLPSGRATDFEDFPVSPGISWDARRVQSDIVTVIRARSRAAKSRQEFPDGSTWQTVVRSRRGWIDSRLDRTFESALRHARDRAFEEQLAADRRSRTFVFSAATDREYASVLLAELGADLDAARLARIAQAQRELEDVRLQSSEIRRQQQTSQALRLLRQSRAETFLKDALNWTRAGGPLDALRGDAAIIVEQLRDSRLLTSSELLVLGAAGDLMPKDDLTASINAILAELNSPLGWSDRNERWEALSTLVPGSGRDEQIAAAGLALSQDSAGMNEVLARTIGRTLNRIDWQGVNEDTRSGWRQLLVTQVTDSPLGILTDLIGEEVGLEPLIAASPGIYQAARLVDAPLSASASEPDSRLESRDLVLTALTRDRELANRGGAAFGSIDNGNVAVAFATKFDDETTWMAVIEYLADPKLSTSLKKQALQRIAEHAELVPSHIALRLGETAELLLTADKSPFAGEPMGLPFNTAGFRALSALNLMNVVEVEQRINSLFACGEPGRLEAARCLLFVADPGGATWAGAVLSTLTWDPSPAVRAEAAFALVQLPHTEVAAQRWERLRELLLSDSVRIPLRIVHACQRLVTRGGSTPLPLKDALESLRHHPQPMRILQGAIDNLAELERQAEDVHR